MRNCIWNTRVRKHNLRGSENNNEHENLKFELNCISGWRLAPIKNKVMMNKSVHDD